VLFILCSCVVNCVTTLQFANHCGDVCVCVYVHLHMVVRLASTVGAAALCVLPRATI